MPRTDERPLAEINIQHPGKITPIKIDLARLEEIKFKKIREKKLKFNEGL